MAEVIVKNKTLRLYMTVPKAIKEKLEKELNGSCTPLSSKDGGQTWDICVFIDPLKEREFFHSLNGRKRIFPFFKRKRKRDGVIGS